MAGQFLCEICFDVLTNHSTAVWDGLDTAVCEDCLAPPEHHPCWQELGSAFSVAELRPDAQGDGYLVRLRNGRTIRFRWDGPLPSRRTQ
ncbi:MAG: hypothetical protein FJZ47_00420 [Candidatus Tectomicrobia bacterium]|uniref:Uncharacterized protein n=1 Tax=Tectimicrobiota bacterium TaxID=2528274 RepID=A0A937VWE4_UNCTE|nr:hypothetical protein [Candidatus Tectomicrobia bacterium]